MRQTEVNVLQAIEMLDVTEEVLGRLAEEGKIKSRRAADGCLYFVREDVEKVIRREIEAARSQAADQ